MSNRIRNWEQALVAPFTANQVRALQQSYGIPTTAYKTTTTSATTTTFANDPELWLELPSMLGNQVCRLTGFLPLNIGAAAGNFKFQFVADQGLVINNITATAVWLINGVAPQIDSITALAQAKNGGATNAWTGILLLGTIEVQNQGVLQLQWAEQAASGTTSVLRGASLDITPIG